MYISSNCVSASMNSQVKPKANSKKAEECQQADVCSNKHKFNQK